MYSRYLFVFTLKKLKLERLCVGGVELRSVASGAVCWQMCVACVCLLRVYPFFFDRFFLLRSPTNSITRPTV